MTLVQTLLPSTRPRKSLSKTTHFVLIQTRAARQSIKIRLEILQRQALFFIDMISLCWENEFYFLFFFLVFGCSLGGVKLSWECLEIEKERERKDDAFNVIELYQRWFLKGSRETLLWSADLLATSEMNAFESGKARSDPRGAAGLIGTELHRSEPVDRRSGTWPAEITSRLVW
jgi:hypothetical protein